MSREWTDEQLSAYLDGELAKTQAHDLSLDLSANPALATRLSRLKAANRTFQSSAAIMDQIPMPPGLSNLLERGLPRASNVISFRQRTMAFANEHRAIAASLFCVAAIGGVLASRAPSSAPVSDEALANAQLVAEGSPLARVLESGHSSDPVVLVDGRTATPKLTFARTDGSFCRQYRIAGPHDATDAIACRHQQGWRNEIVVFGAQLTPAGSYQTAGGPALGLLDAFVDRTILGAPLNAAEEAQAIARSWRYP